jgi:phosphonopyruvate decarboxylase/sulfopyruvate decarboxylase subunit beta
MNRKNAIKIISSIVQDNPIISANGYTSRDLFEHADKPSNFYMIGSMGLSSSIGLGVALKNPKKFVYVFDGDGNILMNLGSLTTIGVQKPKNLVHVIFDNHSHESTGSQPTSSKKIKIEKIAQIVGYNVFKTNNENGLRKILKKIQKIPGPIMILIKIQNSKYVSKRVEYSSPIIRKKFMNSLKN